MAGSRNSPGRPREELIKQGFQKGKSGNPGGIPKWVRDVKLLCAEHTEEAVLKLLQIMRTAEKQRDQLAAAQYILDRAHGKPVQAIASDPENPISLTGLTVTFVKPADSTISGET